jgi:hypothetical protein
MLAYSMRGTAESVAEAIRSLPDKQFGLRSVSVSQDYGGLAQIDLSLISFSGEPPSDHEITSAVGLQRDWINCQSMLPRSDEPVLVCRNDDVGVASHWGDGDWSVSPSPTHWMPMPHPCRHENPKTPKKKRSLKR